MEGSILAKDTSSLHLKLLTCTQQFNSRVRYRSNGASNSMVLFSRWEYHLILLRLEYPWMLFQIRSSITSWFFLCRGTVDTFSIFWVSPDTSFSCQSISYCMYVVHLQVLQVWNDIILYSGFYTLFGVNILYLVLLK
jgi:hypothetical protein